MSATRTLGRWRPSTDDLVDLAFAAVLSALAVIGFSSSFGNREELVFGVPAVIAGTLVGYVLVRSRLPMLAGFALGVLAFFLLGGVLALRDDAIAGVVPTPDVWSGLVDGVINGWARLLTSVPPAPPVGNLVAIPYLAGFAGAALTIACALAWPGLPFCVVPPTVVMAVTVLFGVQEPASLLLQGALFGVLLVVWLAIRVRREAPAFVAGGSRRAVSAVVMLVVVGAIALAVGPGLPGADANERYLLREQVSPPFDPSQYPSPLARFRDYHGDDAIEDVLFTVEGLPPGQVVRFAVMDDYDGYVWRASAPRVGIGGSYERVGDQISGATEGSEHTLHFEMRSLARVESVWVPTAGSPRSIRFGGAREDELTDSFRFNRTTETAASPVALASGDTWIVDATFPVTPSKARLQELPALASAKVDPPEGVNDKVKERIAEWVGEADNPYDKVLNIEDGLKDAGAYSDGGAEAPTPSGHSLGRVVPFLADDQPQGNGEQYAAAVAYAARAIGIPARVVLEFDPPDRAGVVPVHAGDARAMVEIALADVGWVQVGDPTPDENDVALPEVNPIQPEPVKQVQPPPPLRIAPPKDLLQEEQHERQVKLDRDARENATDDLLGVVLRVVAILLVVALVLLGPALFVLALKSRRRTRRRTRGSPAQRIAAGWAEVLDVARDIGAPVPPAVTRREWARLAPAAGAAALATTADQWVFGASDASDDDATRVWTHVEAVRGELVAPLSTWKRLRAAVSLTSLRGRGEGRRT